MAIRAGYGRWGLHHAEAGAALDIMGEVDEGDLYDRLIGCSFGLGGVICRGSTGSKKP